MSSAPVSLHPLMLPAGASVDAAALAVYVLLEPLVAGRTVVDVWPLLAEGRRRLERAGARRVVLVAPHEPPLPLEDGSVDVVLCLRFSLLDNDEERRRWLAEMVRVMSPDGFCVLRALCSAEAEGERSGGQSRITERSLVSLLGGHFGRADVVAETPFLGVSFFVPGTEEIAVNEDLTRLASTPRHNLVFCARGEQAPWSLPESLLIPVDGLQALETAAGARPALEEQLARLRGEITRLEAEARLLTAERDNLREALMTSQDHGDRREAALAALRRETERHLKQISDDSGALEMVALERDRAQRRAERAERTAAELETALKRRDVQAAGLERELARLRARTEKKPERRG